MVEKPIIIVGTGRCGSTIFQQVLGAHPEIAWLSAVYHWYPGWTSANQTMLRIADLPVIGHYLKHKKILKPWEPYGIWDRQYPGFSSPFRDLHRDDVTPKVKKRMRQVTAQMITAERHRLMIKITGWPRVGFLHEIFPDAKFIHVVRDGRAVTNSMLNVQWWTGWRGVENWGWGALTPAEEELWDRYQQSFVALASIEWNHLMDAMDCAKAAVNPDNFLEIRYEDFCEDVKGTMGDVATFCDLAWNDSIGEQMAAYSISEKNYKWQEELTEAQQEMMNTIMGRHLKRYDYL